MSCGRPSRGPRVRAPRPTASWRCWSAVSPFGIHPTAVDEHINKEADDAYEDLEGRGCSSGVVGAVGGRGAGGGQTHPAVEVGDAGAVRRLLRGEGQGVLRRGWTR